MKRWERKLAGWTDAGLLVPEQRDRIMAFERSREQKDVAAYTVIGLGAIIIAIGIMSLIAYNWDKITDTMKLVADFIVLSVIAGAAFKQYESSRKISFEIICAVFFMLIGGSIGLISQVYNTGGEFYEAATVWAAIAVTLVMVSRGTVTVHLWLVAAIVAIQGQIHNALSAGYSERIAFSITILFALLPAIVGSLALALQRVRSDDISSIGRACAAWAFTGALVGTIYLSMPVKYRDDFAPGFWIAVFLAVNAFAAAIAFLASWKTYGRTIAALALGIALYAVMTVTNLTVPDADTREITDAILFILIWFIASFVFYQLGFRKLFNLMIVGIGIRFLVVYFQVFTDLATTGFGLIASGIVIIGLCVLYMKKRESLYALMERIG